MCFDLDSAPPIPPLSGAAVSHQDLELEAADGNRFSAFAAAPEEAPRAGVVILPDVRGLYRFYEELALRFAERGDADLFRADGPGGAHGLQHEIHEELGIRAEILQTHIKDGALLDAIGKDILKAAQNRTLEITGSVVKDEEVLDAKRKLGIG